MAGIGFGIRDLLRRDTFLGFFRAYAYAGVIGSGPWILSFAGILLIHILGRRLGIPVRLDHPIPDFRHLRHRFQPRLQRDPDLGLHALCLGPHL